MKKLKQILKGQRSGDQASPPGHPSMQYGYGGGPPQPQHALSPQFSQGYSSPPGQGGTPIYGPPGATTYTPPAGQQPMYGNGAVAPPQPQVGPSYAQSGAGVASPPQGQGAPSYGYTSPEVHPPTMPTPVQQPPPPASAPSPAVTPASEPVAASEPSPAPPAPLESAADQPEPISFNLTVNPTMWPAVDPGEDASDLIKAAGPLSLDYAGSLVTQWACGANVHGQFGQRRFASAESFAPSLPPLLFDLVTGRTVQSAELGRATYVVISYVRGQTVDIDGRKYGVEWNIPVKSEARLWQILEAVRVVTGVRFVWVDILCLDQRQRNEEEIPRMKEYFSHAACCLVWLDNTLDEPEWEGVLGAVTELNRFFNMDSHNTGLPGTLDRMLAGGDSFNMSMNDREALTRLRQLLRLEKAPWFRRVWTLQEGVIPDRVTFCTPERYMTDGSMIWTVTALLELVTKQLIEGGSMVGTAMAHELQKSEIHKMLKLRQLYRRGEMSYWHVMQGVRSRQCTVEQDRLFGVLGLLPTPRVVVDYNKNLETLYKDLLSAHVQAGEFSSLLFVGGGLLTPVKDVSMPFMRQNHPRVAETHSLSFSGNTLTLDNVACDQVTKVHCLLAWGPLEGWLKTYPEFMDMPVDAHFDVARAFGLPAVPFQGGQLCPASFAAFMSLSISSNPSAAGMFGPEFQELLEANIPGALLTWVNLMHLIGRRNDSALVMLWTAKSGVQLGIVTEPVEGQVVTVMPSSYMTTPGPGCLICRVLEDRRTVRKVGIGLGMALNGNYVASQISMV